MILSKIWTDGHQQSLSRCKINRNDAIAIVVVPSKFANGMEMGEACKL